MILKDPMADYRTNRGSVYRIFNAPLMYRLNRYAVPPAACSTCAAS